MDAIKLNISLDKAFVGAAMPAKYYSEIDDEYAFLEALIETRNICKIGIIDKPISFFQSVRAALSNLGDFASREMNNIIERI